MTMLQDRYISILVEHSSLSETEWRDMERQTTWFTAEQAKEWGLVDEIR
jgi:ATP-dependent protease ClpP protease subunit